MKFIQGVGMKCTQEQYEKDLKGKLLDMGYVENRLDEKFNGYNYIVNNITNRLGNVSNLNNFEVAANGRDVIEEYNPELFLALAAMTDKPNGIKGEWWMCFGHDSSGFKKGKSYKQIDTDIEEGPSLLDEINVPNDRINAKKLHFKKASKEELINQLTITKIKTITVNKADVKNLYDLACNDWKRKMDEYLKPFMFQDTIDFSEELLKEIQLACTPEQLVVFKEIFGELDKNAFVGKFDGFEIQSTSTKLFGKNNVMKITNDSAFYIDRPDLQGRSLYFTLDVEVIMHKTDNGGTIIEVKNK